MRRLIQGTDLAKAQARDAGSEDSGEFSEEGSALRLDPVAAERATSNYRHPKGAMDMGKRPARWQQGISASSDESRDEEVILNPSDRLVRIIFAACM